MQSFEGTSYFILEVLDVGKNGVRCVVFRKNRNDCEKVLVFINSGQKLVNITSGFRPDPSLDVKVKFF